MPTLLIVEDDLALRETLVRSLGAEGFAVRPLRPRPSSFSEWDVACLTRS